MTTEHRPDDGAGMEEMAEVQRSFEHGRSSGTLYLVATPIGNLEDMTLRAIRLLKEVQLIAAEDTRQTRKLLAHYEIRNRLVSYHEHNAAASGPELVRLLLAGSSIALVTDAGMPAISDPGERLAAEAIAAGVPVVPVPGANAALSALVISGLPAGKFVFAGFPPRDRRGLDKLLDSLEAESGTMLFYESPRRVAKTLAVIAERWGGRRMALVRELTKRHEEAVRGTVSACLAHVRQSPPQGEICIVVAGAALDADRSGGSGRAASGAPADSPWWAPLTLREHVRRYETERSLTAKEAMKAAAADRGVTRRDVYQELLREEQR